MTTKYCQCGQPIEVDRGWNGIVHRVVFRDPETGEEITHCPGCGESVTAWLEIRDGALRLTDGALLDEPPTPDPPAARLVFVCPHCGAFAALNDSIEDGSVLTCDKCGGIAIVSLEPLGQK